MHFSSGSPIYCALRIDMKLLAWFGHLKGNESILTFPVLLWNLYQVVNLKTASETSCISSKSGWFLEGPANFLMKIVLQNVTENIGSCLAHKSCPSWGISCSSTMLLNCSQKLHMFSKMVRGMEPMTWGWGNRISSVWRREWRAVFSYLLRRCWEEAKFFSDRTRGHKLEKREIPVRYDEKSFHHDGSWTLEKIALSGCTISIFRDIQNLTGQVPEQFGVIRPDSSRGGWKRWSSEFTPT